MTHMRKDQKCNLSVTIPKHMRIEKAQAELAKLSRGLAHPARAKIITILAGRPREDKCYCGDIVKELPLAQSTVSQHLKILKDTGWVQGEIHGPRVCYCLVDGILKYYHWLLNRCMNIHDSAASAHKQQKGR